MKQRKSYDLSAISASIKMKMAEREAFVPHKRPAICRAAIQLTYKPGEMELDDQEKSYLEANSIKLSEGHWELTDSIRRRILAALQSDKQLLVNYTRFGNPHERYSEEQGVLGAVLKGWKLRLGELSTPALKVLFRVKFWVDGLGYQLPSHEVIRNILARQEIAAKFQRQTSNFSGRKRELATLKKYVFSPSPEGQDLQDHPPLLVYGIGGIGKSTLISKFLLDEAIRPDRYLMPFVYLDFDHPGLTISNPLSLFAAGMRQLAAQFPAEEGAEAPLENALGDLLAAQALRAASFSAEGSQGPRTKSKRLTFTSASWQRTLNDLSRRHLGDVELTKQPILIVLDSFEEAQYRTGETAIRNFLEFLNELTQRLPNLRLLIVGRSDLVVSPFSFQKLPVGDFDAQAAQAYLRALGVARPEVRSLIQMKVGGNPLTLKLAAALAAEEAVGTKVSLADFADQLAGTQVQELLVRRNVEHIRDPEVQQLALPGMLLRRIDAGVIQHVLAPVCGLGTITDDKARELFEGLQRVTFLIEMIGGELHFRRDLRIALREDIWRKQQAQCVLLHRKAVDYYQAENEARPAAKLQAEYHYHVFQLDGKPREDADNVDWTALRPFLEDALLELPPPAAAYLARQFKVRLPAAIMEQAGQEENDWSMVRRMEEVAVLGYGGIDQMAEVWEQVQDRTESNAFQFIYFRQLLALRLGHFDRMLDDLSPRAFAKLEGMDLYLNLLRHNYQATYRQGIASLLIEEHAAYTDLQALEFGVLLLKFHGLLELPFPEDWCQWFSDLMATYPDVDAYEDTGAQFNWRPFTVRLWDVHKTEIPQQREQFVQLCRAIHTYYAAAPAAYANTVSSLSEADPERFSLVLQNETKKLVEDISSGGIAEVAAHDYADFLVEYFGGDWKAIYNFLERLEPRGPSSGSVPPPSPRVEIPQANTRDAGEELSQPDFPDIEKDVTIPGLIEELEKLARDRQNEEALNQVYLLSGRFHSLDKNREQGVITDSDLRVQEQQIRTSLNKLGEGLK